MSHRAPLIVEGLDPEPFTAGEAIGVARADSRVLGRGILGSRGVDVQVSEERAAEL
jgi:hypothetical protein